jgi:gliding motility-associated lipoprotein GldH
VKNKCLILFVAAALTVIACADKTVAWQQTAIIDNCVWNKDSAARFNIVVEDTLAWYSLSVDVRNRTDYSFQNLYIFLNISAPNGVATADTLNFVLARDDGKWTGAGSIFSKYRENTFPYRRRIRFPQCGTYAVGIRHGMRKDDLEGIFSVGLTLNHTDN